jgi:predicted amidohydrolase YtcJ
MTGTSNFDRLLVNGNIHTLSPAAPRATAVAISRDRIVAVGDDRLREQAGPETAIDDLGGRMALPGLTDAHIHWEWTSSSLRAIDLMDTPTKDEALRRVAERAATAKPGEWLIGRGWAQASWPGGAFPTAGDVDAVTPNNPVYLTARSGHAAWVNTAALKAAGIGSGPVDPAGGVIQRDNSGKATGILLEDPAMDLVADLIPRLTANELADLMEQAQTLAWKAGLTGIHDFDDPDAFEAMELLHEQGRLGLRVVKNINRPYIEHAIRLRLRWGFGDNWLRLGGMKLFADGALGPRTALMIDPYDGEPDNRGVAVLDKEEIYELVSAASRAGFPSTVHAIGDKAVHDVLDVYETVRGEEAARGVHPTERRHRIEHVQLIHPDDAHRLGSLDVIASMQPIHATSDYQMADRYWGARAPWSYNARMQIDMGARVAFGSDSPVEPFEPLKGIHAAATRRRADGSPGPDGWYPEARLTMDEAIRGYTLGPAYAAGMEDRLGMIAPGYLADLVVFDHDLYTVAPDDLLGVQVIGTMVDGTWRYRSF